MYDELSKCIIFLSPRMRAQWFGLIPISVVKAALEALSATCVFALISLVNDPAKASETKAAEWLQKVFPSTSAMDMALLLSATVVIVYSLRTCFVLLEVRVMESCARNSRVEASQGLFRRYMAAPYAFHLGRNSADLIRNMTTACTLVCTKVLSSAAALASEILVIATITALLLVLLPGVLLGGAVVVAVIVMLLLRFTQHRHRHYGQKTQDLSRLMLGTLQESLGVLKEIRILGRENYFDKLYERYNNEMAVVEIRREFLVALPKQAVETIFVFSIVVVLVLFRSDGGSGGEALPVLGLVVYAGSRILPSINRMIKHLNNIRYGSAAIDNIVTDWNALALPQPADQLSDNKPSFQESIQLKDIAFKYPDAGKESLSDINLTIERGAFIGLIGTTGAGKTTLVDVLLGLLSPTSGEVLVDGQNIQSALRDWQELLAYVPQAPFLIDDTLRKNIALGLSDEEIDDSKLKHAVQAAQLEPLLAKLPDGLSTMVGERGARLSGGEKQRLAIARALYKDPQVLILDEATSALDNETERLLNRALEDLRSSKTVIAVSHRLHTVKQCDYLILMHDGKIRDIGAFDELIGRNKDFEAMVRAVKTENPAI
jgi:ABC-type multidrug transport system fused ATPase/permease subunit